PGGAESCSQRSLSLSRSRSPTSRQFRKSIFVFGPVVKGRGIEVGAVGPHQRVGIGIDADLVEQLKIAQRPIQLARQHRLKVDRLLSAVLKMNTKRIRRYDFERLDLMNRVFHLTPISKARLPKGCFASASSANRQPTQSDATPPKLRQ